VEEKSCFGPPFFKGGLGGILFGNPRPSRKTAKRSKDCLMLSYNPKHKANACHLRANMTDSETVLWSRLRRKQILGIQFYRQKPIGNYIVDFYAPAVKLVIEVDGSQHLKTDGRLKDQRRDAELATRGLTVLRFDNLQVLQELEAVMESIFSVVCERFKKEIPPRSPLLQRGEVKKTVP
jgi:very-short-patch-repair endonuclease